MQYLKGKWLWLGILILLVLSGFRLQDAWQLNMRALLLLEGNGDSIPTKDSECDHFALKWAEAGKRGDLSGQHQILEHALSCSQIHISIIRAFLPLDKDMALMATQLYPDSSESWDWLGKSIELTDNLGARQAYLRSIELSPHYGLTWCRLGKTYEYDSEFEKTLEAYLKCCHYGDPGSHGCYGAGRMMEQLNDPQQAIEYYRLSKWEGALKRANELENQVSP